MTATVLVPAILGVLLGLLVVWRRRRKAARRVAAVDATSSGVLLALTGSESGVGRHRAPASPGWFRGSGGAM